MMLFCALLLCSFSAWCANSQALQVPTDQQLSSCLDVSDLAVNDVPCSGFFRQVSNEPSSVCIASSKFLSPCSGIGDCVEEKCTSCGLSSSKNFVPYLESAFSDSLSGGCASNLDLRNLVFAVQPFVVGYPNSTEGPVVVPLPTKVESLSSSCDEFSGCKGVKTNDFQDGTQRSTSMAPESARAFTSNIYFGAAVVEAVDSMSDTSNILYDGGSTKAARELLVGVGVVLQHPASPAVKQNVPQYYSENIFTVDPLADRGIFYRNRFNGESYAAENNRVGFLNFTSSLAEVIRYLPVTSSAAMVPIRFNPSGFSGEVGFSFNSKDANSGKLYVPNIVMTTSMPFATDDVLRLPSTRLQDVNVTALKAAAASTTLYSGSFPRTFSFSVSQSRRVSTTLLHKSWNVFGCGSLDRSASFMLTEMARAASQPSRNIMVPFSLFRNEVERAQVLQRAGRQFSPFYFELVYPVGIDVVPNVAKVIFWSDGSYDIFRLYSLEDNIGLGGTPEQRVSTSDTAYNAFVRYYISNNLSRPVITSHQRMSGDWVSVVYRRQARSVVFFGINTHLQFGQAATTANTVFPLNETPTEITALDQGDNISSVAVGETHTLILTSRGRLLFSGRRMFGNSSLDFSDDKNVNLLQTFVSIELTSNAWYRRQLGRIDIVPLEVVAGYGYTALLVNVVNNSVNASVPVVPRVLLSGAPYMSSDNSSNITDVTPTAPCPQGSPAGNNVTTLMSGRFHFCVTHCRSHALKTFSVSCKGKLDVRVAAGVAVPADEPAAELGAAVFPVANVESVSVGSHHVVITVVDTSALYGGFRQVFAFGSNRYGQLGAGLRSYTAATSGFMNPRLSVRERITSTRSPSVYLKTNQEQSLLDARFNYHLYHTVAAQAVHNNTYVFQRLRSFNTPQHFMLNFSNAAHQRPPDGKYSLTNIAADIVPEWEPFTQSNRHPLTNISNATELVWDVRFSLIKGLALFLVQNQTVADGRWVVPPQTTDCTLRNREGFSSGNESTAFYRDWRLLRRNITQVVSNASVNSTHYRLVATRTITIPSIFFVASNGSIYPLTKLSNQCGSRTNEWCDPLTKTVICNSGEPTPLPSYQKSLGGGNIAWMAMFVSVDIVNVTHNETYETYASVALNRSLSITSREVVSSLGTSTIANRDVLHYCSPKLHVHDCSSMVYYQSFFPARKSPSSFFAFAKGGLSPTELPLSGSSGLLDLAVDTSWRKIIGQCVFLKLGRSYYFVMLHPPTSPSQITGDITLCETLSRFSRSTSVSLSPTIPPTIPPLFSTAAPTPATAPPTPPPFNRFPSLPFRRWESGSSPQEVRLRTVDKKNNLLDSQWYLNETSNKNLDANNVSMVVGPHGAVAVGHDGRAETSAYMLFSNESIAGLIQEQQSIAVNLGPMGFATNLFIQPMGTLGTYHLPFVPIVEKFNVFVLWIQPTGVVRRDDAVVIRFLYSNNSGPALQFAISSNGTSVEVVDESLRSRWATRQFYYGACVVVPSSTDITLAIAANPNQFYCTPRPIVAAKWTRFMIRLNNFNGNQFLIYMDSDLVAAGRLATHPVGALTTRVVGMTVVLRNRAAVIPYSVQLRDIAFCYDYMSYGHHNGANPFPCNVNARVLTPIHNSVSESRSDSLSASRSETSSETPTDTPSNTQSGSVTTTLTATLSPTDELSESPSETSSFSITNYSISETVRYSVSNTTTRTIQKNVSALVLRINQQSMSAYSIRKVGVPVLMGLVQDEFNPIANWYETPNSYMLCHSNVNHAANPSGFCASFGKKGFCTGTVDPSNKSQLLLQFGPAVWYNSYQDEYVQLTFLSSAAASQFRVAGAINFTVEGVGYRITSRLRIVEASGALFALSGMILGGPASNVVRIATNSILLNFHCFNDEEYPLSWLVSTTTVEVDSSTKLGVAVVNFTLIVAIAFVHLLIATLVYYQKRDTFLKAQGDVYFPGLTFGLVAILLPGYIHGAWQGAIESDKNGHVGLVAVAMVVIVLLPVLFLIHSLYDTANFTAKFVPFPPEVWKSFAQQFPLLAVSIPPGRWVSTDRHYSYVRRFHHMLWEFRDTMQHWFCLEFGESIFIASISTITNSNPVACVAQLACFVLVKLVVLAALLYYRPHSTPFGQWPAVTLSFLQTVSLIFVVIDAIKGGTKAYQSAYTAMLFVNSMLLTVHSLLTTAALVWYRYLKRQEQRLMLDIARQYHSPGNQSDLSQKPNPRIEEKNFLIDGTIAVVPDIPLKVLLQDSATDDSASDDSSNTAKDATGTTLVGIMERLSSGESIHEDMVRRGTWDVNTRDFWRIAAMESLTGVAATGIPLSEDTNVNLCDEDLL